VEAVGRRFIFDESRAAYICLARYNENVLAGWCIWDNHFERTGGCSGSAMAPLERAMVVSYRLSIVSVALSLTIRLQFAIEVFLC